VSAFRKKPKKHDSGYRADDAALSVRVVEAADDCSGEDLEDHVLAFAGHNRRDAPAQHQD